MTQTWHPQPRPGSKVKDRDGVVWEREPGGSMWSNKDTGGAFRLTWLSLLDGNAPLTLVMPRYELKRRRDNADIDLRYEYATLDEAQEKLRATLAVIAGSPQWRIHSYHPNMLSLTSSDGERYLWAIDEIL